MKKSAVVLVGAVIMVGAVIATVGGCLPTVLIGGNKAWVSVHDPVREAEATRVAIAAQDEAKQRSIERQILAAQAREAQARADAAEAARPAAIARNNLVALGIGGGALVLAIGSAFAAIAWLNKRATSIYPNSAGQYPIIVRRSWNGITIVHDPSRAIGPTTIYTIFSIPAQLAQRLGLQIQARSQEQSASESAYLQVASQAQAVSLMAAATRPQGPLTGQPHSAREAAALAQSIVSTNAPMVLPPVEVATDVELVEAVRMLEAGK